MKKSGYSGYREGKITVWLCVENSIHNLIQLRILSNMQDYFLGVPKSTLSFDKLYILPTCYTQL